MLAKLSRIIIGLYIASFSFLESSIAQCSYDVTLNLVSVNFESGCDFTDFGGIDGAITITDLSGNILINNEVEDLGQVNGPADDVPFNLSSNPDCCQNGYTASLGIFPAVITEFTLAVEIYDNDGGCCNGYQANTDDNYGSGNFTFDLTTLSGTIDVGSCISFNYTLDLIIFGEAEMFFEDMVCYEYEIEFNDETYNLSNPTGIDTLYGQAVGGCDSIIYVDLSFFDTVMVNTDYPVCFGDSALLDVTQVGSSFQWSTGETSPTLEPTENGNYAVSIVDQFGCLEIDTFFVEFLEEYFVRDTFYTCESDEVEIVESEIVSPEGCDGQLIQTTLLNAPFPSYTLSPDLNLVARDTAFLSIDIDETIVQSIQWYVGDSLICDGCFDLNFVPEEPQIYDLVFYYHEDCFVRESINVAVESLKDVYIPNIFSPSEQGENQTFKIYGLDIGDITEFLILDRWGNRVYQGSGLNAFWDGRSDGEELQSGVYSYYIEIEFRDGIQAVKTGTITLIK